MFRRPIHQRRVAWIAALLILLGALLPLIGQALMRPGDNGRWIEICTSAGMILIADPATAAGDGSSELALDRQHCPLCLSHAGQMALPPDAQPAWFHASTAAAIRPVVRIRHPALNLVWLTASSRGPPRLV